MFTDILKGIRRCGENIDALDRIVNHAAFPKFLSEVRDAVGDFSDNEEKSHLTFVTVCKGGNARGVTVVGILSHVFARIGYMCGYPNQLHKLSWKKKRICFTCRGCDVKNPDKLNILGKAFRVWKNA